MDRRRELVSHALRAIRVHGARVGMDEIAARAGTSKTVIYRHFGDRAGLYDAVVDSVHSYIHAGLTRTLERSADQGIADLTRDLADSYLALVERDTEIYRFVLERPVAAPTSTGDPAGSLPSIMGDHVAQAIAAHLDAQGLDATCAPTWGHGLVGFIRAAADRWMAAETRVPRAQVVAEIDALLALAVSTARPPAPLPV